MDAWNRLKNYVCHKEKACWFLLVVGFLFILLRLPSLIEPNWYGDEAIYQVIGQAMRNGDVLYRDIWDNKPPLLYVFYAIFNGDIFYLKLLSLLFGLGSVVVFYFVAKRLLIGRGPYIATGIFAFLFATPLFEGNIANAENFLLLPTTLSLLLLLSYIKSRKVVLLIWSALLVSFSFLIKAVAIFDFATFFLILFLFNIESEHKRKMFNKLKSNILYGIYFIVPIIIFAVIFFFLGAFGEFIKSVFSGNVGYVEWQNNFFFPMGELILKTSLLVGVVIFLLLRRNRILREHGVIYMWLAFSVYSMLFSGRPYTHYVLVLLPALSLLIGLVFSIKQKIVPIIILVGLLLFVYQTFGFYKKTFSYYINYLSYVANQKSIDDYQTFFDARTPGDYEIARFIKAQGMQNSLFLWSDSPQIYILSGALPYGKYVVAYHIATMPEALEETKKEIEKNPPTYIIQTSDAPQLKAFIDSYILKYQLKNAKVYEREI